MSRDDSWELDVTVDEVIRGQGADPAVLRARSARLVAVAESALEEGLSLARPRVLERRFEVESLVHQRLVLGEGFTLSGELIAQHLASAQELAVVVCTVGGEIEARVSEVMASDMSYALALYGAGSAVVESLANEACRRIELEAAGRDLQATIPLSPGMIGWPVEEGQRQIFDLVDGATIGVTLSSGGIMHPLKSLSMVIGLGVDLVADGRACDYCTMRESCRFRDHYAPVR